MVLNNVLTLVEDELFEASSNNSPLFNQYNDINGEIDVTDADEIRRGNLRKYLRSFSDRPSVIVVGEAPGWRGCRFSGVPFTSEFQLSNGSIPFVGNQSSNNYSPYKESTATIFWDVMRGFHSQFFAWNCIPFHPHKPENPLSNRTPKHDEIITYLALNSKIISLIKPDLVVSIGKSAKHALKMAGISSTYVRHPSHGGKKEFRMGMEKIFG